MQVDEFPVTLVVMVIKGCKIYAYRLFEKSAEAISFRKSTLKSPASRTDLEIQGSTIFYIFSSQTEMDSLSGL